MKALLVISLLLLPTVILADICVDNPNADCKQNQNRCLDSDWRGVMQINCPVTCNLCGACLDQTTKCSDWVRNGFCQRTDITDSDKMLCAKSCHLC